MLPKKIKSYSFMPNPTSAFILNSIYNKLPYKYMHTHLE